MLRSIAGIVAPPSGPALPCRWQQTDSGWQLPLIITTARKWAEAEGWDAVTTRRLSSQIEYSQPVLYKHFGMEQIADAIAIDGFGELADVIRLNRAQPAAGT
jgi:Bacterial regulatory proteins, tetR family